MLTQRIYICVTLCFCSVSEKDLLFFIPSLSINLALTIWENVVYFKNIYLCYTLFLLFVSKKDLLFFIPLLSISVALWLCVFIGYGPTIQKNRINFILPLSLRRTALSIPVGTTIVHAIIVLVDWWFFLDFIITASSRLVDRVFFIDFAMSALSTLIGTTSEPVAVPLMSIDNLALEWQEFVSFRSFNSNSVFKLIMVNLNIMMQMISLLGIWKTNMLWISTLLMNCICNNLLKHKTLANTWATLILLHWGECYLSYQIVSQVQPQGWRYCVCLPC